MASETHSAVVLRIPRNRNLLTPICSFMIPKTGSTRCCLCWYASLAKSLDIQFRWRRSARSWGPYSYPAASSAVRGTLFTSRTPYMVSSQGPVYSIPDSVGETPLEESKSLPLRTHECVRGFVINEPVFVIWVINKLLPWFWHHHLPATAIAFLHIPAGEITGVVSGGDILGHVGG